MREASDPTSHSRPMRLEPEMVIGAYQVVAPIGVGGMGEVYRARDLRLRRDVALKVVSARWHDAAQLVRFKREARVLASLNHPHIASIYGLEECTDVTGERTPVIVLELVEGQTLLERIAHGPLPMDEATAIALQIAEALEAAHDHGVVHRDLKPANVKITRDGSVKVLDFGLAKAIDEHAALTEPGRAPTEVTSLTSVGVIVGTPAYMAPEQARGAPGDRRDDIWAFGAVLFEMLAGVRAFQGATSSDVLAAVLTSSPDWSRLPSETPPRVRRLIGRCLERDVRLRLQAMGEARIALSAPHADDATPPAPATGRRWLVPLLAGGAIAIVAAAAGSLWTPARPEVREGRKLDLMVDGLEADLEVPPVVSPDGRRVVYRAHGRLWVRSLTDFSERPLSSSDDATYAAWAPDSRQIAFVRNRHVWRVPLDGSGAVRVGAAPSGLSGSGGAAWTSAGQIVLSGSDVVGLYALPLDGGPGHELLPPDRPNESDFHELSALPDGRGLVFTAHRSVGTDAIVAFVDGARRTVLEMPGETLRSPVYSPSGHLLFQRASPAPGIWAIGFALDTMQTSGPPFLVVPGGSWPSTATDGTLVLVRQSEKPAQLVWVSRAGTISPIAELEGTRNICTGFCAGMAISPDRQRVAMALRDGVTVNLWTYDLGRAAMTRLLTGDSIINPTWSADGRRLFVSGFFGHRIWNVHHVPSTRAGTPARLLPKVDQIQWPCDVSPDGKWLVYAQGQVGQTDLWAAPLSGSEAPRALMETPSREVDAKFSPDGRWLAYTSDESGRFEVYVRAFASVAEPIQVSTSGASLPAWSPDGRELFFRSADAMMVVTFSHIRGGLQPRPPRRLFVLDSGSLAGSFGVATEAKGFLFIESGDDRLSVVLNWAADADRLVRGQQ